MKHTQDSYHPEPYWTEVANRIDERSKGNVIAGDDEPFYRYKRVRFLEMLESVAVKGKKVAEVGCGPGGNLKEVIKSQPRKLTGIDISQSMLDLAASNVPKSINLVKTNGTEIPFDDQHFDIVFTATVLQHNTDEAMLTQLIKEICRISSDQVFIFERIESEIKGDDLCYGRAVSYYAGLMKQNGFELVSEEFININTSYYVCGAIRKLFNPSSRKEGESLNGFSNFMQNTTLALTKQLDKVFTAKRDLGKLEFRRIKD